MGLDVAFRHLITQVGWAAPLAVTALVIGGVASLLAAGAVSGRRGTQGTSR